MEISFVKSGGFAGPMTRIQGKINLRDGAAEVTGDASYHRQLDANETQMLRAGAEPSLLSETGKQIAAAPGGRGAADLEHYTVTVKTSDGKTQEISLNIPGGPENQSIAPAAAHFLNWLQSEAQKILAAKMK